MPLLSDLPYLAGWDSEAGKRKWCSVPLNSGPKQRLDYYECYALCRVADGKDQDQGKSRHRNTFLEDGLTRKIVPTLVRGHNL